MQRHYLFPCQQGMKWTNRILLYCLLAFAGGCKKDNVLPAYYDLTANGCTQKQFNTETVTICLDSVLSDSRCPRASTCVWAGVAEARFVSKIKGVQYSFGLATNNLSQRFPHDTTISGYTIRFVDLLPYPGDPPQETKAIVEILK